MGSMNSVRRISPGWAAIVFCFRWAMFFFPSVIVRDLHAVSVPLVPLEADAVLVVDANAVLPFATSFEPLQPVARRQSQVAQRSGRVQHLQLLERSFVKARREGGGAVFCPQAFRLPLP